MPNGTNQTVFGTFQQINSNCTVEITQYALQGQKLLAQGIALGITMNDTNALQGQKHYNTMSLLRFCPCECIHVVITQGDALGYELFGLSARFNRTGRIEIFILTLLLYKPVLEPLSFQ